MMESHVIIHLLLAMIQFLTGVLANGVIVSVHGTALVKQCRMTPLDLLLSCVAVSRLCLQLMLFFMNLMVLSLVQFQLAPENFAVFIFVNQSGLWLASWLSTFYCAKIATFAHPLFQWLKVRISKLVPWLVLASLLFSSITAAFQSKEAWIFSQSIWMALSTSNTTTQREEHSGLSFTLYLTGFLFPLLIFLISVLLSIFSLGRHSWQMRRVGRGAREPGKHIPVSAYLSILSFLLLFLFHYLAAFLLSFQLFQFRSFLFQFCIFVIGSYPSGHSIILILGNPKLKQNAKKFFCHRMCCL